MNCFFLRYKFYDEKVKVLIISKSFPHRANTCVLLDLNLFFLWCSLGKNQSCNYLQILSNRENVCVLLDLNFFSYNFHQEKIKVLITYQSFPSEQIFNFIFTFWKYFIQSPQIDLNFKLWKLIFVDPHNWHFEMM